MTALMVSRRTAMCVSAIGVTALATVACQPEEATASHSVLLEVIEAHRKAVVDKAEASVLDEQIQHELDATLEDSPIVYDTFIGSLALYGLNEWLMSDFDQVATDRCLIEARTERLTAISRKYKEHNSGGGWIDHRAERAEREAVNQDYFAARTARDEAIVKYRQRGTEMGLDTASSAYEAASSTEYEAARAVLQAPCRTMQEAADKAAYISQHQDAFRWMIEEMDADEMSAFLTSFSGGRAVA